MRSPDRFGILFLLSLMLLILVIGGNGIRNLSFLQIQRQLMNGQSVAWGLGLRSITTEQIRSSIFETQSQWFSDTPLGLQPFVGEELVSRLGDCVSRRLTAQRLVQEDRLIEARSLLYAVTQHCPTYAFTHIELGLIYDRMNQPDLAVGEFEAGGVSRFARQLVATNYFELARSCRQGLDKSGTDKCRQWLSRALELVPLHPFAAARLASIEGKLPNPLAIDPNLTPLWNDQRLNSFAAQGLLEWAEYQSKPGSEWLFPLARRFALQGDYSQALNTYRIVEEYEPENLLAYYYSGLSASTLGQWSVADKYFSTLVRQSPFTINYLVAHARVRAHLNDSQSAIQEYLHVLDLNPCVPEALAYLAAHSSLTTFHPLSVEQRESCIRQLTVRYEAAQMPTLASAAAKMDNTSGGQLAMVGRNGFVVYGPYQSLLPGKYKVTFRLRTSQPLHPKCLRIDVSAETNPSDGLWLVPLPVKDIEPTMFTDQRYADVILTFDSIGGSAFEYRVQENCGNEVWVNWISVMPVLS